MPSRDLPPADFYYTDKESLLALVDEAENKFFNLFETAARHGWISGERFQDLDQLLSHLVIKYDIPQSFPT